MTKSSFKNLDRFVSDHPPGFAGGLGGFRKQAVPNRGDFGSRSMVRVIHGAHVLRLPVAGKTVGEVRYSLESPLNVHPDAQTLIQGDKVADDYVLTSEETLEFLTPVGYKGVGQIWSKEEFCEYFRLSNDQYQEWKNRGLPIHNFADGDERITETDFDLWSASHLGLQSPWLTTEQAAAYLHTSVKGIYGKVERGELSKGRGGLFSTKNLDDYARGDKHKRTAK